MHGRLLDKGPLLETGDVPRRPLQPRLFDKPARGRDEASPCAHRVISAQWRMARGRRIHLSRKRGLLYEDTG
jgi:hypothetical protein